MTKTLSGTQNSKIELFSILSVMAELGTRRRFNAKAPFFRTQNMFFRIKLKLKLYTKTILP